MKPIKPFYIESDEEVTSVIDRLRASQQQMNVFVVPAGATLLQSAVNMRLLLREAQKAQKDVAIVTTDEYGKILAQKIGITTYEHLSEIDGIAHAENESSVENTRSTQIGSSSYYDDSVNEMRRDDVNVMGSDTTQQSHVEEEERDAHHQQLARESASIRRAAEAFDRMQTQQQEQLQSHPQDTKMRGAGMMDMHSTVTPQQAMTSQQSVAMSKTQRARTLSEQHDPAAIHQQSPSHTAPYMMDEHKQKEVRDFFGRRKSNNFHAEHAPQKKSESKHFPFSSSNVQDMTPYVHAPEDAHTKKMPMKRMTLLFGIGALVVCSIIGAMIFLPRVTVALMPTVREESVSINVTADATQTETAFDQKRIGLILLEKNLEKTVTVHATGTSTAGSYKARGSVTIYNNYSTKPQKLVATTRLLTDDGVLFRLVDSVTVPGTHKKDGVTVPGSVVATVIADKPGEASNIGPSKFSIPGFKGSPRYKAFWAESKKPMIGGSAEGGTQTVVTKEDLEGAQQKARDEAIAAVKEDVKRDAQKQGKKVLDDAITVKVLSSEPQIVEGVAASSFDYTVRVVARALAFSETDIMIMATKALKDKVGNEQFVPQDVVLTYSPSLADFEKQVLELKVRATSRIVPQIDTGAIQRALAGAKRKNVDQILSDFPGIESAELRYNVGFLMGRLPWYKGSITVIVKQ